MTKQNGNKSLLFYARVVGCLYMFIIIIGIINGIFIDSNLIVSGNDSETVNNILANELLFRIGILSILVMYAGVVILSWALYVLLKNVNRNLALLALLFRSGEAILGAVTMVISFIILLLINGEADTEVLETGKLDNLVGAFLNVRTAGLDIVLLFVGLGGTIFCYLFLISMYVPKILAFWGIFTYLSMIVLALISILFPNHPAMLEIVLYSLGGLFELVFGFWLLIKGVKLN